MLNSASGFDYPKGQGASLGDGVPVRGVGTSQEALGHEQQKSHGEISGCSRLSCQKTRESEAPEECRKAGVYYRALPS